MLYTICWKVIYSGNYCYGNMAITITRKANEINNNKLLIQYAELKVSVPTNNRNSQKIYN